MWKWFKNQPSTIKGMIIVIIISLAGIILRWNFISKEVATSVKTRINNTVGNYEDSTTNNQK